MNVTYPFVPKSTSYLVPGQFWGIPLDNGLFACGRVLQLNVESGRKDKRQFLAGLMDWCDTKPPTELSIANSTLLAHGGAHIKTIVHTGESILGYRSLQSDKVEVPLTLDQSGGAHCRIRRGFELLDLATSEQLSTLPVFSTWGYNAIRVRAAKRFGTA